MRALLGCVSVLVVATHVLRADVDRTFESDPPGAAPPAFTFAATREAVPGRWLVEQRDANRFLTHAADVDGGRGFALALPGQGASKDLAIAARLKFLGGKRQGGLVWRYQDEGNFYLVRLDLADQKMAIDRVFRGNRIRIEGTDDLELDAGAWHTLRVRHEGDRIRAYLGGVKVFDTVDRTFREAGRVGLWASSDSAIAFDDFSVEER